MVTACTIYHLPFTIYHPGALVAVMLICVLQIFRRCGLLLDGQCGDAH